MAHDELTQGMALTGHILLGNHEVIHTNGSVPITSFYPIQVNRVRSLDPVAESHLEWSLHNQQSTACQDMHERRNHPWHRRK
jgi:hypothetical protein